MTLFANTPNALPEEEAGKLFAAGISFMSNKAYSSAYSCFDRLPATARKDFLKRSSVTSMTRNHRSAPYRKALPNRWHTHGSCG